MAGTIIVVGAGMVGLACATRLAAAGQQVSLFDKGRGPGGRMATRRAEVEGKTHRFDHGAQFFTARDDGFRARVEEWQRAGVVARWQAAGEEAWVGTPAMNAPIRAAAEPLDVSWGTRVAGIQSREKGWRVSLDDGGEQFSDSVVLAIPAEQAAELLAGLHDDFAGRARRTVSRPCWALMAVFPDRLECADTLRGDDGEAVSWAARNGAKPGRDGSESWVVHASPEWSEAHLEDDASSVAARLLDAFLHQSGAGARAPVHMAAHRWRYAMVDPVDGPPALWDATRKLGVCGDWLIAPRVESAWVSGTRLAETMLDSIDVH